LIGQRQRNAGRAGLNKETQVFRDERLFIVIIRRDEDLMPINSKYPLDRLIQACRSFPLPNRRMITFEYILIKDQNDRDRDAHNLCRLLSGLRAKINLIPLNADAESPMSPPTMDRVLHFQEILTSRNFTAIIRKSKGRDILAACGQLRGAFESKIY